MTALPPPVLVAVVVLVVVEVAVAAIMVVSLSALFVRVICQSDDRDVSVGHLTPNDSSSSNVKSDNSHLSTTILCYMCTLSLRYPYMIYRYFLKRPLFKLRKGSGRNILLELNVLSF